MATISHAHVAEFATVNTSLHLFGQLLWLIRLGVSLSVGIMVQLRLAKKMT